MKKISMKNPVRNASDEDFGEMQVEDVNCFISRGSSLLKLHNAAKINRLCYGKRLCKQVKLSP
jgi:hypothetical protein